MSSSRIVITSQMKMNITSSIDLSSDQSFFSAVTRFRAHNSSMYSYQIELYDLRSLKLMSSTPIYDTYSEQNHPCKIVADGQTIAVATKYHVIFYDNNLKIKHKVLHNQIDIYDLNSSPDSKIVAMVGDNTVLMWDTVTFKSINFPFTVSTARTVKFSPNNNFVGVSSTTSVSLFQIRPIADTYDFILRPQFKVDGSTGNAVSYGTFNSFDFNPINSMQIVIGFGNSSPRIYNFDGPNNDFIKLAVSEQPTYMNNFKIVKFMPDGKRVFSSDHGQGAGLWPNQSNQQLLYRENFIVLGPCVYNGGKKILGYQWQNLKFIQIQFQCSSNSANSNYLIACQCSVDQYFSLSQKSCVSCIQNGKDICKCENSNQYFNSDLQRCIYDCSKVANAIGTVKQANNGIYCYCQRGYVYEKGKCIFDCSNIIFAVGNSALPQSCQCQPTFAWNNITKTCSCDHNSQLVKNAQQIQCNCLPNYQIDPISRKCMPACSNITNSNGTDVDGTCLCKEGYQYKIIDNIRVINELNTYKDPNNNNNITIMASEIGGCFKNCSMFNFTQGYDGNDGCICRQNMVWDSKNNICKIDCKKLENGMELVVYPNGTQACTCAGTYNWVWQNMECGKNCENVSHVNRTKYSTAIECPCVNNFQWVETSKSCVIDCTKVKYSQSYSLNNSYSCICRSIFYWNNISASCVINCSEIWDAKQRISDGECSCNKGQTFNKTALSCQAASAATTFGQPWVWALIGVGGLFLVIVAIVMLRFCWSFATNKNQKQPQKKLKKTQTPKVKKRKQKKDILNNPASSQRAALSKQ